MQAKELHVIQVHGRWLVATNPYIENMGSLGILANFKHESDAVAWRDRYTQWQHELAD